MADRERQRYAVLLTQSSWWEDPATTGSRVGAAVVSAPPDTLSAAATAGNTGAGVTCAKRLGLPS